MLIQEVLEELVPLVLLDELEELFVAEGLRGLLVTTGDPEILPVAQRRDEVVLGPLSLLPLLLLGTLLGLRHELREALLPLARSVEGVEAPVLLDKLQRLLPLHGGLHALLLQELHEGRPPLLWRRPLGLLLLLLLLLLLALVLRETPEALQLSRHLPHALLGDGVVEVVAPIRCLVLLPACGVQLLLGRLEDLGLIPTGLLGYPVVIVAAPI
mmetsp:Transcript_58361/g.170658  ORF Transcript_58361/g.170658 Transcript_58361/m.170658 type:complete len:213 (-) Transcript_58361:112-750(-)